MRGRQRQDRRLRRTLILVACPYPAPSMDPGPCFVCSLLHALCVHKDPLISSFAFLFYFYSVGMASPGSPSYQHQLTVHPLLRNDNGASTLYYNALFQPNLRNHLALHHTSVQLHDRDLHQAAINPPCNSISVTIAAYPGPGAGPVSFPWRVTLTSPRRSSVPNLGQASVITVYDVLASLWTSLNKPVVVDELNRFRPEQVTAATAQRTYRISTGAVPNADPNNFVRSDFLYGCVVFAGITRNADNSLSITLIPRTN